jgi:hypothetical protein
VETFPQQHHHHHHHRAAISVVPPWAGCRFTGHDDMEWVPPLTRQQEWQPLYRYHPESQVWVVMAPSVYLGLTRAVWTGHGERFDDDSWKATVEELARSPKREQIMSRLRSGTPLDAAYLDVDPVTLAPIAQEGAHRGAVALEVGLTVMPVIVYARRTLGGHEAVTPAFRRFVQSLGREVAAVSMGETDREVGW